MVRCWYCILGIFLLSCDFGGEAASNNEADPIEVDGLTYQSPKGVVLDIPRLLGRTLPAIERSALGEQLGELVEERQLPGKRGLERRYKGGVLRLYRGQIYYVAHVFDVPVARVVSLQQMGLPGNLSPLKPRSLQFRIDRPGNGIRRIALKRAELNSDMISKIEIWSFLPTESY